MQMCKVPGTLHICLQSDCSAVFQCSIVTVAFDDPEPKFRIVIGLVDFNQNGTDLDGISKQAMASVVVFLKEQSYRHGS